MTIYQQDLFAAEVEVVEKKDKRKAKSSIPEWVEEQIKYMIDEGISIMCEWEKVDIEKIDYDKMHNYIEGMLIEHYNKCGTLSSFAYEDRFKFFMKEEK